MTAATLLTQLRSQGASLKVVGDRLRVEAPKGVITPQMKAALASKKGELVALLSDGETLRTFDIETSRLAAAKFVDTAIGDFWAMADAGVILQHPEILRAGLPVFSFSELRRLIGRTANDLRAAGVLDRASRNGGLVQ